MLLTVPQQMALLGAGDYDGHAGKGRALASLVISTGVHPSVLAFPEDHDLEFTECYWSWRRAKTDAPLVNPWSPWMLRTDAVPVVQKLLGKTPQWLGELTAAAGRACALPGRVGFNRLRHTYFVNLARLGVDPWAISQMAGTHLDTIGRFYMVGKREAKVLSPAQVEWLQLVMGV